jgi:hypothetical protein
MKSRRYFKSEPHKAAHFYSATLCARNWRVVYRSKYAAFIHPRRAAYLEQFIERLPLNTVNEARTGNPDEMYQAI